MSQFEEDGMAMEIEEFVSRIEAARQEKIRWFDTEFRRIGYARYDKLESRLHRFLRRLTGQKVMSREQWNEFVDTIVEEAIRIA